MYPLCSFHNLQHSATVSCISTTPTTIIFIFLPSSLPPFLSSFFLRLEYFEANPDITFHLKTHVTQCQTNFIDSFMNYDVINSHSSISSPLVLFVVLDDTVVAQSLSRVRLFMTPWNATHQAPLFITVSQSLLRLMSIESVTLSNHLILCNPLLLLPSIFPSIKVFFQWTSCSHRVAKVLELQPQHQSFQWTIQGWLPLGLTGLIFQSKGLSRVFSSTTIQKHQFFGIQFTLWSNTHLYTTTRKATALTIWTFVGKVMSLLFTTLDRLS